MTDATFFTRPKADWQRRYEALRASFVERLPAAVVADRFGYAPGYIHLLRHQFRRGKIDFDEPVPEGLARRRGVTTQIRQKIRAWRGQRLSAGEITQLLTEDGVELSVRTVERVLAEEGFPKLPRRTRLKLGRTVLGTEVPAKSKAIRPSEYEGRAFDSPAAGIFLFAPLLAQLGIMDIVRESRLPGTQTISAVNYLLSFLALKLLGNARLAHVWDHSFDPALGLFAGLNVLPQCTTMSTYSYRVDEVYSARMQKAFLKQATRLGLYDGGVVNLDFHTVPHYGEESVLEKQWAGARGKVMKGALTLLAQDAETHLLVYSDADIQRAEADDAVLEFLAFWRQVRRGLPILIFDSRLTSHPKLSELNAAGVKFITLRRRGKELLEEVENLTDWKRIHIPHPKRKYPNPRVHESPLRLRGYDGVLRQLIVKGNGHEKPTFLITNDHDHAVDVIVGNYARRWRVENGIAEAVKFFHLNAPSSPILVKAHFDVVTTILANTLYTMLAKRLRGFEECDAPKLYRHFVGARGTVCVHCNTITVTYPRRAHNPILRAVPWNRLPTTLPWLGDAALVLHFK
ncbi:MAG: transposase, partial [Planctomycetes bacterium]|nr:transposase [Planctomycetota bacterium]